MDRTTHDLSGPSQSRRGFLVTVGTVLLGEYLLPGWDSITAANQTAIELPARRIQSPPKKTRTARGFFLLWIEETEQGCVPMIWKPETPEEQAEAQRFYEDSRGYRKAPPVDPKNLSPLPRRSDEEKKLIKAILDDVQADAPRLEYADWLRHRGNTLGECARLWCLTDQMGEADPRTRSLTAQLDALVFRDAEKWFKPLAELGLTPNVGGTFAPSLWLVPKGFIESMEIQRPGVLPDQADRIFCIAPLLNRLSFNFDCIDIDRLALMPQLNQISSLEFRDADLTVENLRTFVSSRHLGKLRSLSLPGNKIGPEGGRVLGESTLLSRLRALDLSSCNIRTEGLQGIANGLDTCQLNTLSLDSNKLSEEATGLLASVLSLRDLKSLSFSFNPLNERAMQAMQSAAFLPTLETLALANCVIDARTATAFAALPFSRLLNLEMKSNPITTVGAKAILLSSNLTSLQALNLEGTEIDGHAIEHLRASGRLSALTSLVVSYNSLTDKGITALASVATLTNLKTLNLTETACTARGAKALATSPFLANLTVLDISRNDIGPDGAIALANSQYLAKLKSLSVTLSSVGERGREALVKRFGADVVCVLA